MVYAEKIVTAIQRGTANTRWRDFADLYHLTGRHDINGNELNRAITAVAAHRHILIRSLGEVLNGFPVLAQTRWATWRRRYGLDDQLPESFADILNAITAFTDPILTHGAANLRWNCGHRRWIGSTEAKPSDHF